MSEIKVNKISPTSGGGTVTLATSGDTIQVPSGVTIANSGTATGFGGGNLGQVTQHIYQTQVTQTTADHDIMTCASITPASSSSRFLIKINLMVGAAMNPNGGMILYRDSTPLSVTDASPYGSATDSFWSADDYLSGMTGGMVPFYWEYIDSPATPSAIVYKLSAKSIHTMYYNRQASNATSSIGISTMTLMELLS
jgi:hypothetical protein